MLKLKVKTVVFAVVAATVLAVAATSALANPSPSGPSASALTLTYQTGPNSTAQWLTSSQSSELQVGATTPAYQGYANIVLHNFPVKLPTEEPSFNFTGADLAGELRWYINLSGHRYVFGYPSPVTASGSGGAPFTWEIHGNGAVTYFATWTDVLNAVGNARVHDVLIVADDSGENAPYTDVVSNVQYAGQFPVP